MEIVERPSSAFCRPFFPTNRFRRNFSISASVSVWQLKGMIIVVRLNMYRLTGKHLGQVCQAELVNSTLKDYPFEPCSTLLV